MNLSNVIAKIGIKPNERVLMLWSVIHALATGCYIAILVSVPMAIFISKFGSAALPYGFIANAIASLLIGLLYVSIERKITFSKLQLGVVVCITAIIFLAWMGITVSKASWIVGAILVLSWVIYDFSYLEFWSVLNRLYTLQQAKRLFGLLGMVNGLSGMIMGFLSPLLIQLIGINQLLLIATVAAGVSYIALARLRQLFLNKMDANEDDAETEDYTNPQLKFNSVFKNKYLLLIFIFCILYTFLDFGLEQLFNTLAAEQYPDENTLGSFLGIFGGIVCGGQLLLSMISPLLLKRLGVIISLVLQPVIIILLAAIAMLGNWLPLPSDFPFWAILALQLYFLSYSASVRSPALLVLYQPLKSTDRSWVQSKIEIVIIPLSTGVIGLLMLFANNTIGTSVNTFSPPIIIFSFFTILTVLSLKKGYINALNNALTKPYLFNPKLASLDKNLLPLLQTKLSSVYPEEVIFALKNLEKLDNAEYLKALESALDNSNEDIQEYAIRQIENYPQTNLMEKVYGISNTSKQRKVRAAAYQTLAASSSSRDTDLVLAGLENSDELIKQSAIIGLLTHMPDYHELAEKKLADDLASNDAKTRKLAASLIGHHHVDYFKSSLIKLIDDYNLEVRKATIVALGELKDIDTINQILETKDILSLKNAVIEAVIESDFLLLENIETTFPKFNKNAQRLLVNASKYISNTDVVSKFLVKYMDTTSMTVRHEIFLALLKNHYVANKNQYDRIENLLDAEMHHAQFLNEKLHFIPSNPDTLALRGLLERFLSLDKEHLLALLSFTYGSDPFLKIRSALEKKDEEQISYAIELLDTSLSHEHKIAFTPLFMTDKDEPILQNPEIFNQLLHEIIINKDQKYRTWVIAAAIYYVGEKHLTQFSEIIKPYVVSQKDILKETACWAVERLDVTG